MRRPRVLAHRRRPTDARISPLPDWAQTGAAPVRIKDMKRLIAETRG